MPARFPEKVAQAIDAIKYLRIRAGSEHRFTAVWTVVVDGRVLVRSWNDKADGWYRAFLSERTGAILVEGREVPVRAIRATGPKLLQASDAAYAAKYTTKANRTYVDGFATAKRHSTTLELVPGTT